MAFTVGSVCSGIEAASVAWASLGMTFKWFSEIADFPSKVLQHKYPETPNYGDMKILPKLISSEQIESTDIICGGTPCQAFSFAGWQNGLSDERGNLTLKFVDIVEANDLARKKLKKGKCIVFWENVEGVLSDKTNAFGCLVSSLAGLSSVIQQSKWATAGVIHGPNRNVAWRVLDAKFFGLPQQRRRLYVVAGGPDFYPENILFEEHKQPLATYPKSNLKFMKDGHNFEIFREYTDCLYSSYGTKWNGNAAANNGSLFVVQDKRIRRLSPLECERLMGFPDGYTDLLNAKKTLRYQATGNSWAVPVVKWIGNRLVLAKNNHAQSWFSDCNHHLKESLCKLEDGSLYFNFGKNCIFVRVSDDIVLNCSSIPEDSKIKNMSEIISPDAPDDIYISPVGCYGIIRRKNERKLNINKRLESVLLEIASEMSPEQIEKRSRIQKRGRFST